MEDIGDFVVLKQLVTFCPQVLKYIYMYIYYTIAHAPICLIFHMEKFPADMEKQMKIKIWNLKIKAVLPLHSTIKKILQDKYCNGVSWVCTGFFSETSISILI